MLLGVKGVAVIIVSESSAKVTLRVRTERRAPVRVAAQRHTTTHSGTRMHNQSVFTPKCSQGISVPSGVPGIVLRRITGIKGAATRRR